MLSRIHENIFKSLTRLRLHVEEPAEQPEGGAAPPEEEKPAPDPASPFRHKDQTSRLRYSGNHDAAGKKAPERRDAPKVGRNDECPCGSGKKYKKCCGQGK
jgi:preprotein translocase subunit SecA